MVKTCFRNIYQLRKNVPIDESMWHYFGKHVVKQGEPIRFRSNSGVLPLPRGILRTSFHIMTNLKALVRYQTAVGPHTHTHTHTHTHAHTLIKQTGKEKQTKEAQQTIKPQQQREKKPTTTVYCPLSSHRVESRMTHRCL